MVGDTASLEENGKPLPGVAQVAIQQGRHAAKVIHSRITGGSSPAPFSYFDKGTMAVVGKGFAVLQSWQGASERIRGVAHLGIRAPPVPGDFEPTP